MNFRTLIRRSLRFHWRSHLGVVLGAAVGSAALIGALVVGDSVRESLHESAFARLGAVQLALNTGDRLFNADLEERMGYIQAPIGGGNFFVWTADAHEAVATFHLQGTATRDDASTRANEIQIYGVAKDFWSFSPRREEWLRRVRKNPPTVVGNRVVNEPKVPSSIRPVQNIESGSVLINTTLAAQLNVKPGDVVILRSRKPTLLSNETALNPRDESTIVLRMVVGAILDESSLGNFNLTAQPLPPLNAFVNINELWSFAGNSNRANLLLVRGGDIGRYQNIQPDWHGRLLNWIAGNASWLPGKIQAVLGRIGAPSISESPPALTLRFLTAQLRKQWRLDDAQFEVRTLKRPDTLVTGTPDQPVIEVATKRIFLDKALTDAVLQPQAMPNRHDALSEGGYFTDAMPLMTYLATLLRAGTNATPYSMITAAGAPWTPADLRDDEIVVSQWLAEDLQVKPGNEIALSYFLPESGAKLTEATNSFRVRSIVPPEMPWADRALMPDFPGIEKAESTSEWDAGFPLTYKVRTKDDEYWKKYRGTPKAFITLAAGQKIWGNRFGNLTAIRFPIPTNAPSPLTPALSPSAGARENRPQSQSKPMAADGSARVEKSTEGQQLSPLPFGRGEGQGEGTSAEVYRAALEKKILTNLKPEELGLRFEPVREQALKAAEQSQDFGGLFLGFSFFVIGAALLLVALLFSLGLEQRAPEIGTLLALGFTPKQVRKLLLREAMALSLIGGVIGAVGGIYYAKGMLHGLTTIWRDAVGATTLNFHVTGQTLVIGVFASVVVSVVTIWLTLRKFVRRPARELLAGETQDATTKGRSRGNLICAAALTSAAGTVGWTLWSGETNNAELFFSAGSLVLVAGLSFVSAWLGRMERRSPTRHVDGGKNIHQRAGSETGAPITLASLAVRGCARRRKRSLSTVAMLACGSFLIVSIGVFRLDANRDATKHSSGTGGFALMGETTMPVVQDLNSKAGRDAFALDEKDLAGVSFVPFRVRAGDEASCLNLNAALTPRLLGVKAEMLGGRFTAAKGGSWEALRVCRESHSANPEATEKPEEEVWAIGDVNSIQWAMHKKVGDTIDYVDERGQPFKVRIVGAVANSILQGQLIIDEADFVKRFPGESGYRMFLVDAPSNAVSQVSTTLSRAMQDVGLELTPAAQRLDQFNAVQNTYLGTFQVLGGLGLLLGSVGLGIVVLRNVLERRGELAVLLAVGFRRSQLQRLLLVENGALLTAGLALGVIAAAVAVLPALLSPGAPLPYASLALTLGAVLVNGALWTWAATRWAVRGDLLKALRNE